MPAQGEPERHLFVYGSLVDPRQLDLVLGHAHRGERLRARLAGFARRTSPRYGYPFLVAAERERVDGVLIMDLDADDVARLDAYEDTGTGVYQRIPVEVEVFGCGPRPAQVSAQT